MRALAVLVTALLLAAGCGSDGETAMTVDWDLSHSHTLDDVDWPDRSISSIEPRPLKSVRIRFSGGRELSEDGGMKKLALDRSGDAVIELGVHSDNATVEDAYRLALRWAAQWKLPTEKIEQWHAAGGTRFNVVAYDPKDKPAAGDPYVSLKLLSSFEDDRPVSVALNFFWPATSATQPAPAAAGTQ